VPSALLSRAGDRIAALRGGEVDWRSLGARLQVALERLPLRVAFIYALLLIVMLQATVEAVYSDADIASGPVIGDNYPGGPLRLGFVRWFEAFWLERGTRWIPGHRYLWTYGAYALTLLSLAAVAWSAKVATERRWTGWTFFVVPFCATAVLMPWQFAWSGHALAWVHVLLTAAFLVACAAQGGWFMRSPPVHVVLTVLLAVSGALGYASDRVLEGALVIPILAGGVLFVRMLPRPVNWRVSATCAVIGLTCIFLAPTFSHIADKQQITAEAFQVFKADPARRAANVDLFWKTGPRLLGGDWSNPPTDRFRSRLTTLCALLAAALLVAGIAYAAHTGLRALRRPRQIRPALTVFVVFWGLSVSAMIAAFIYTTAATDIYSSRYLVSAAYGVVALAAVAAAGRPWSRGLAGLALGIIAFAGFVSLAHRDLRDPRAPTRDVANIVQSVGLRYGAYKGYAGYWTAAPVTWLNRNRFKIYPTSQCQPDVVCQYNLHFADHSKRGPKQKTMIVIDHAYQPPSPYLLSTDPHFGRPLAEENFGRIQIYAYDYDVATKFGPK
jgi:hypothetical protein